MLKAEPELGLEDFDLARETALKLDWAEPKAQRRAHERIMTWREKDNMVGRPIANTIGNSVGTKKGSAQKLD